MNRKSADASAAMLLHGRQALHCGYAPRTVRVSRYDNKFFIGCKDGSVTEIARDSERVGTSYYRNVSSLVNRNVGTGARSLCELDNQFILVGHNDGALTYFNLRDETRQQYEISIEGYFPPGPVRALDWLDRENIIVSYRGGSCLRVGVAIDDAPEFTSVEFLEALRSVEIRSVFCLSSYSRWVLLAESGKLYCWDGRSVVTPLDNLCGNDIPLAYMGSSLERSDAARRSSRPAKGVFIAANDGVFWLRCDGSGFLCTRLSLPALAGVPASISYTESLDYRFLWVADLAGQGYLYWANRQEDPPMFRRSSVLPTRHKALLGLSQINEEGDELLVGEACRNGLLIISLYCLCTRSSKSDRLSFSLLLGHGSRKDILNLLLERQNRREKVEGLRESFDWSDVNSGDVVIGDEELLVELFERMGSEELTRFKLFDSLLDPHVKLAGNIVRSILKVDTAESYRDARRVFQLWTLSLLGVIHRYRGNRESAYLGLMTWLRNLHDLVILEEGGAKGAEALEHSIRFARKWGLLSDSDSAREELVRPIGVLRRQQQLYPNVKTGEMPAEYYPEALERLTLETLLFERGVNEIDKEDTGRMYGRTAWDVSVLEMRDWYLAAVSWRWGGVELFVVDGRLPSLRLSLKIFLVPRKGQNGYYLEPIEHDASVERRLDGIRRIPYGYCRALLLSKIDSKPFLITNIASGADVTERLMVWRIGRNKEGRLEIVRDSEIELERGESVYSLARVSGIRSVRFAAGLPGKNGRSECLIGRVIEKKDRFCLKRSRTVSEPADHMGAGTTVKGPAGRNRIWSLAALSKRSLVAGCEDGRILLFDLRQSTQSACKSVEVVGSLNSPVLALACKKVGEKIRVVAGGEDGSVVCLQEVSCSSMGVRFASLWATSEEDAVSNIFFVEDEVPMVLAITRGGRSVFFFDKSPDRAYKEEAAHPVRVPFPGCRNGRPNLRGSSFAAAVVRLPASARREVYLQPYAVLLTASADGLVRLLGIHDLRFTDGRRSRYQEILDLWRSVAREEHQWRLAEAVYRSAPALSLILVRLLLDPTEPGAVNEDLNSLLDSSLWSLPRHLRPLRGLLELWEEPGREAQVGRQLELALRRAWQLEDLSLFQEICSVILKRVNYLLFTTVRIGSRDLADDEWLDEKIHVKKLYVEVLGAMRRSLQRWIGTEGDQDARARIVVASNLVDGDTVLKVLQEAARERRARSVSSGKIERPFVEIFIERSEGVRQLVFKRHPLVSLEALRAANLALMRACYRLCNARGDYERPVMSADQLEFELQWPEVFRFFEQVMSAAARTIQSRLRLTDALAHEYSRTFALAICACPSATIRITSRMAESQLISNPNSPEDLANRVGLQISVLPAIGITIPGWAKNLYTLAAKPPSEGEDPLGCLRQQFSCFDDPKEPELVREFGVENTEDLHCLSIVYGVAGFFSKLADLLSRNAQGIDITKRRIRKLQGTLVSDYLDRLYPHSKAFWLDCLESLVQLDLPKRPSGKQVRPEVVLFSRRLAVWANDSLRDLDNRYANHDIFEPEYTVFRRILARLHAAAETLPWSAAMQKNLVLGVLGHHLLEDLDEHVMEMEEIAQAVAPRSKGKGSIADQFSEYIIRRSRRAAEIPKNLRSLHFLVEEPVVIFRTNEKSFSLGEILRRQYPHATFRLSSRIPVVNGTEVRFLGMVLDELAENHRKYGRQGGGRLPIVSGVRGRAQAVRIKFHSERSGLERLHEYRSCIMQQPIPLGGLSMVESSGMGLYLANMVAAIVNWELIVEDVRVDEGWVKFKLSRKRFV